ncbi:MAG: hypothetical protein ABW069_09225 [Duganella sp.]
MSISAFNSTSATSQASFLSRLSSSNAASSAETVRRPPPPDGGGLIGAISDALSSIGITDLSTAGTDAAAANAGSESGTGSDDVAQALGGFLQSLMGALHAQNAPGSDATSAYSEGQGQGGGPGKLESDLQSLLSKLTSGSAADSAGSSDPLSDLETAFQNLLDKVGNGSSISTSSSSSTAGTGSTSATGDKLASFLQALQSKVGGSGSSGNLVDTSV